VRGAPVAWFSREFGNRRIKVWAIDAHGDQRPVVTNIEVITTTGPRDP
jgi:hypothetical protein